MALDTATVRAAGPTAGLAAELRLPVWNALADRADALRRALPPRPNDVQGRFEWWRSLSEGQARDAALLDRLDALCGHLAGRPVLGCAEDDPLPNAALEEVDGFLGAETAELVAEYRRLRGQGVMQPPPGRRSAGR
ncbi:hypothetical protein OHS33_39090 (plasmid) [Streptomyces sp. NBC_00536]|uniref:hypothetical protein n=1 Tax=Streptomyces sp. NBC_00536 TaxID=2975769 RepID=UPI002E8152A5|nr:hypothetical protein [Streptomyces sp. NBC_00536]WUC84365.1 hypothetical protein OHS33_39090 [Streptomyces sp. NBC_00536]